MHPGVDRGLELLSGTPVNLNRSGSRRRAWPALVAALVFFACHSESITGLPPEASPLVNKVVFDSDRDDVNGELYAIDLDDGSLTRLTNSPFRDLCPVVSPDGLRIAFYSSRLAGQLALYIMYADGSNVRYVDGPVNPDRHGNPGASCPKWSGDGSRVIYLRYDALPATGEVSSLRSVSASGSSITEVASGAVFYSKALSPDGSRALFSRDVPNNSELHGVFVANVNGGGELALARDTYRSDVSWSPDGRTVVYTCPRADQIPVFPGGRGALCFSGPAGENWRRLELDPSTASCGEVEWSPDSSIVLCSGAGGIYRIDAVSGTISRVVALGTRARWSGDGARIVFVQGSPDAQDIIVADVSGAHAISLTQDAFNDDHPSFGPSK